MEKFFGENADKYRYAHAVSALTVIPYMACVDEFQHRVFEEMAVDAKVRRKIWRELEQKYIAVAGIMTATLFLRAAASGCRNSIFSSFRFIISITRWLRWVRLNFTER